MTRLTQLYLLQFWSHIEALYMTSQLEYYWFLFYITMCPLLHQGQHSSTFLVIWYGRKPNLGQFYVSWKERCIWSTCWKYRIFDIPETQVGQNNMLVLERPTIWGNWLLLAWTGNQTGGWSLPRESHLSSGTTSPPPLAAAAAKIMFFLLYDWLKKVHIKSQLSVSGTFQKLPVSS